MELFPVLTGTTYTTLHALLDCVSLSVLCTRNVGAHGCQCPFRRGGRTVWSVLVWHVVERMFLGPGPWWGAAGAGARLAVHTRVEWRSDV